MTKPPGPPSQRGTPPPLAPEPGPPHRSDVVVDGALRAAGAVVALWGGILLGTYGTFMTPFRVGAVLVPVSILLAVLGNLVLIWFAYTVTRHRFLALLPGIAWAVLAFLGANSTKEGDLVLFQSNWVGPVYLFAGAITIAVAAYRLIVPKQPPITPRG